MTRGLGAQAEKGQSKAQRLARLLRDYAPIPGIPDEFLGDNGRPREKWGRFLDLLATMAPDDLDRRFATADRHIRDTGVSYRAYGEAGERSWPLSHVPLIISENEWQDIASGIEQRARLNEKIISDIYGDGNLVRNGAIPAAAITGSPDFLRPLHGVKPPGGRHLQIYAADIGRGPDGRWWVLGDRTQAPSGAGYALANRLVLSRAFPQLYRQMNVERLAPFFQAFRSGLAETALRTEPRIGLLTPGPYSETYFEQAYLARYLGLLLVEGGDLVMRDGAIHVRTIDGLKRADVLWRRVDADFTDPLELRASSALGVPGLVEAVRAGGVVVANSLGSGVMESRALMSFLPSLCQRLLGESLTLPNIATWWCGQEHERADVLERLDHLAIAGAFGNTIPGAQNDRPIIGASLDEQQRQTLREAISTRGVDFVGQEVVSLSTTPVWQDGRLTPRPFILRVYATNTANGWRVMPGGFCRISDRADARAISMGEGAQSADVWIIGEKPVEITTLLPAAEGGRIRRIMGNLPSRAADNLFWFGRYLERAEATLRLIRSLSSRLVESDTQTPGLETAQRIIGLLRAWGAIPEKSTASLVALAEIALHSGNDYGSTFALARDARRTAATIRERLSVDTWHLIVNLKDNLKRDLNLRLSEAEIFEKADEALRTIAAISGLAQENMNRVAGWRFLELGRRVERAINTCRVARHFASRQSPADDLDVLLDLADSQITYRSRYLTGVALAPIRDMVILDPYNPRSVAFQVERLQEHLAALPELNRDGMMEAPRRILVKLMAELSTCEARNLDNTQILAFEQHLMSFADAVGTRYFLAGPNAARADKSTGLA